MDLPGSSKSRKPVEREYRGHFSATARKSNRSGSVPPLRSRNYQKPWPSTKGTGSEELVKYMSDIPSYLRDVDCNNFQEKALNVGVLDWKYLEKWKDKSRLSASRTSIGSSGNSRKEKYSSVLSNSKNRFSDGWQKTSKESRDNSNKDSTEKSDKKADSCIIPLPSNRFNKIQQEFPRDGYSQDRSKDQCSVITDKTEVLLTTLQVEIPGRCSSFKSTGFSNGSPMEMYPESILHEDVKFIEESRRIPHSSPFPHSPFRKGTFKTIKEDRNVQDETKPSSRVERGLSPTRQFIVGLNRINRSSSLRDASPKHQLEGPECSLGNKAKDSSKGRQSPLRRILDPLLKPMNRIRSSSSVANIRLLSTNDTDKSLLKEDMISTEGQWQSCEKQARSTKQALLQLAWKNGLPLYMFSFNDNDILVATVGKKNDLFNKDDSECSYTIFSVQEVKKKSGTWQTNKSKKDGLVSNVVGQIKISSRKTKNSSDVKEFLLFGSQVESVSPRFQVELAAVLVKDEKINCHSLQHNSSGFSTSSSIVAILPSGVHGSSGDGHPTPLIDRWMSGGLCDCGGWDEGCTLTVLTDILEEGQSGGPIQAHDGTHRIELFLQGGEPGGGQEGKHTFTMVAFKEGLYTVDFGSSVGLLQAFFICISILHSRKSRGLSRALHMAENKSLKDHFSAAQRSSVVGREALASYVPNHPPLSPFGRA